MHDPPEPRHDLHRTQLFNFFEVFRKVKAGWHEGPNLLGIHLEGPFFNAAQAGAQDPKFLQLPTRENFMPILEAGGADIMRISVAVELEGSSSAASSPPSGTLTRLMPRS